MELNIITLLYLFFRLAPFVIVSFFALSSLFNQDIKGLIYLVGLLLACFLTVLIGNSLNEEYTIGGSDANPVCNLITIGIMLVIKNYIVDNDKINAQIQENKLKEPKKQSKFQRKMQEIMEQAEAQKAQQKKK